MSSPNVSRRGFLSTLGAAAGGAACGLGPTRGRLRAAVPERMSPLKIVRTRRTLEGWNVEFDDRLDAPPQVDLRDRAARLLGDKLYELAQILPADRLERLRRVRILVDLDHGLLNNMQYHPGAEWLRENGYDPAIVKCFHIPKAAGFTALNHQRTQPWCVLHELAHAYHDQVLGFDDAEVRAAHDAAVRAGTYAKVLHIRGHETEHYALKNPMEFFAELSESYVGTNDFYPFVRGELKRHDPRAYELLEKIWGKLP